MGRRPRFGSLTVGARVLWNQLRSTPGTVAVVFVATLGTSVFVTAVPRVLERASEDDLRETITEAAPAQRNIRAESTEVIGTGPDFLEARGQELMAQRFPSSVQSVIAGTQYVFDTPRFRMSAFPGGEPGTFPVGFHFRYQQGIGDHLTLISGSMPEARPAIPMLVGGDCPPDRLEVDSFVETPEADCAVEDVPVFETVVTAETAELMEMAVGDLAILRPDPQEQLWALGLIVREESFVLALSGIVELSDPASDYWYGDDTLHRPRVVENPDFRFIYAAGLMTPDQYGPMLTAFPARAYRYTWRYFVDPDLVEEGEVVQLAADVEQIVPLRDERVITFLGDLIDGHLGRRALTVSLMSTAVFGLLVAGIAVVLVLAALDADRQSAHTVLIRDRGASRGQLTLTAVYSGLLLVVPATILGYLMTTVAVPESEGLASGRLSAALVLGGMVAVVGAGSPYVFGHLGPLQRMESRPAGSAGRRLVTELFVLAAAAGSVALLRRRGFGDVAGVVGGELDALLAFTPAVVGVAAGIVVLRLVAPLMRGFSWLAAGGRSLVAFVGLRRLVHQNASGRAPIAVIILAVAVAVFSSVVREALQDGQSAHSWQVVGGDVRVEGLNEGFFVPVNVDAGRLGSGRPWAEAAGFTEVRVIGLSRAPAVNVLAVDASAFREVLAGSGSEVAALDTLINSAEGEAPALVSSMWTSGTPDIGVDFGLEMGSVDPRVTVAGVVDHFPSLPVGEPFVVLRLDDLRHAWAEVMVRPTALFFRAAESEVDRFAAEASAMDPSVRVTSRYDVLADVAGDPFALWVQRALNAIFYLASGFAVVAALALLIVTAPRRRRDLGFLRTVGLTPGQAAAITAVEQLPQVVVATFLGGATGGLIARLLAPALDVEVFTGGLLPAEIRVDPLAIVVLTVMMAMVMAGAVVSFVAATRKEEYARLLRIGTDQ